MGDLQPSHPVRAGDGNTFNTFSASVIDDAPDVRSFIELAQAGDTEAFGELCRIYETGLLRHAMSLCGNRALAEDLTQDTLVEAWRCLHRYNRRCQLFTWLCAILIHRYRNTLRQKRPAPLSSLVGKDQDDFWNVLERLADPESQPDQMTQAQEQAAHLWECLQTLPSHHQEVIYLRFYVDDSLDGIAVALGCSVGTVKSRLFRALESLRAMHQLNAHSKPLKSGNL